jgi:hypothetical protein
MIAFLAKYLNDQIKEDRIGGSRDTHVEEEKLIQGSGRKT